MKADDLIPLVAILLTFSIPIVAIVLDFRRRKLQFDERRAMLERGMELPPLQDPKSGLESWGDGLSARREKSLHTGVTMVFLGAGLGVGAWVLQNFAVHSFIPREVAGPLSVGAAIVLFVGIGNLVYFAVSAKRAGERA